MQVSGWFAESCITFQRCPTILITTAFTDNEFTVGCILQLANRFAVLLGYEIIIIRLLNVDLYLDVH